MDKYLNTFTIHVTGENTGEIYGGAFTVKTRLSHRDHLNRDAFRRQIIGPNPENAYDRSVQTAEFLSQLSVRIVKAPAWWTGADNGMGLLDDAPMIEVFERALKAEKEASEEMVKKGEQAKTELAKTPTP